MAGRALSSMSTLVLRELTAGPRAVLGWTSLHRVEGLVGGDTEVARVVVAELEAAGHVTRQPGGGERLYVHVPPVEPNPDRFKTLVESLMREAVEVDHRVHADIDLATDEVGLVAFGRAMPARRQDAEEWVGGQGLRALTMLTVAWERGWYDLVWPFSAALGGLFRVADHHDHAREAVRMGIDAVYRLHRTHLSSLRMLEARLLSDRDQHEDAERAATAALLCALQAADSDTVMTAYGARGQVREHAGRLADAANDFDRALTTARSHNAAQRPPSEAVLAARFDAVLTRLERAATLLGAQADPVDHARLVDALTEALGYAQQADPTRTRLARAVGALQEMIPQREAADLVLLVGKHAEQTGRIAEAREYYRRAMARYDAADLPQQAEEVRTLLTSLTRPEDPPGRAE
ncbi:hypothetical protein [Actinocrispum wychmicini]|uniref:Tetratricopeptide repeat protein n=1 Tax=Actinocrispum wychmicini TaxID=1213861 RepID=A0A4R2IG89_9PSEU|nr:hypothetical protein [Actinocrispum wychmicini]TCO43744.1 hypothetical protein EV192_1287 [Actinocrispum wychmicini]